MNEIKEINIKIIDVLENNRTLIVEKTQLKNPEFIVNGADDKFVSLMTTELHFNLLVSEATEAIFFHLFTGVETRYKVIFEDATDANNLVTVWTGFLLPEQFTEPFVYSDFFVSFVATDGIGRLKNIELNSNYYSSQKSTLEVLNQCLLQTGLRLPILFAPAIENTGFDLNYNDLDVNTFSYNNKGDKLFAYDVIKKMLVSIGCRLFQYKNQWVVVGLNRINDAEIVFKKYTVDSLLALNYIEEITLTRTIINKKFLSSPTISLIPPLKNVVTTWNQKNSKFLIPEDVVAHYPVDIDTDIDDRTAKYWTLQTDQSILFLVWLLLIDPDFSYSNIDFNSYYNGFTASPNPSLDDAVSGPFVFFNTVGKTILFSDLPNNFAYLDPVFVYGSDDLERFATLEIEFNSSAAVGVTTRHLQDSFNLNGEISAVENNGFGDARFISNSHGLENFDRVKISSILNYSGDFVITKIDANTFDIDRVFSETAIGSWKVIPFQDLFYFGITYKEHKNQPTEDETMFLSNFPDPEIPAGMYDFKLSVVDGGIKGVLKLEKILMLESGYYTLRLYPAVTNANLVGRQIFTKCIFTLKTEDEKKISNARNLDFTASKEIDVFHSDSQMALSERRFLFSDEVHAAAVSGTLFPLQIEITTRFYSNTEVFTNGFLWYNFIVIGLSDDDFTKVQNGYQVFVKRNGTTEIVALAANTFAVVDSLADGGKVLIQYNYAEITDGAIYIAADDTLYLRINTTSTNTIDYADYWLTKWRRFGEVETIGYMEAINAIYHGCLHDYNLKITGNYTAFLTPFDLIDFKYKGDRRYTPVKMALNLTEGTSAVTLVESKYTSLLLNSDDLVSGDVGINDAIVFDPAIAIVSTAVAPAMFSFSWSIQTNYTFTGFAMVNAIITAQQLTAAIDNGGVATGVQKTATITNASGMQVFNFPIIIGAESGWWQIDVVQNGVVSNTEFVEVSPAVVVPSERIEIASVYIGDVFNVAAKYSINYIGFSPVIVTQSLQKFDLNTQVAIGSPVVSAVANTATEIDLTFASSGIWKVTISADGKTSNEIAWFTIII